MRMVGHGVRGMAWQWMVGSVLALQCSDDSCSILF